MSDSHICKAYLCIYIYIYTVVCIISMCYHRNCMQFLLYIDSSAHPAQICGYVLVGCRFSEMTTVTNSSNSHGARLACCAVLELCRAGLGVNLALKAVTLLFIGGASSTAELLMCQYEDGGAVGSCNCEADRSCDMCTGCG